MIGNGDSSGDPADSDGGDFGFEVWGDAEGNHDSGALSIRQMTISASHRLLSVEFTAPLNGLFDTRISCPIFLWIVFVSGGTLSEIGLLTRYNNPRSQHEICIALECDLACVLLRRLVRPGLFPSEIPPVSSELP